MPLPKYKTKAKVWLYPGAAAWHFITLPKKLSAGLKNTFGKTSRGFGSLPVTATIGQTSWQTSIFPDTKTGAYMLPIKAQIRRSENIDVGNNVAVQIEITPDR